jgi:hypothetical protein
MAISWQRQWSSWRRGKGAHISLINSHIAHLTHKSLTDQPRWIPFGRLKRAIFLKLQIRHKTEAQIYNATVSSITLYYSKTWPITQTQLLKVDGVPSGHFLRIECFKIVWQDPQYWDTDHIIFSSFAFSLAVVNLNIII